MTEEIKTQLQELGFAVILQEVSAFQPMNSSPVYAKHAEDMLASYEQAAGGQGIRIEGTTVSWIIERTITALFDEQVKTCVEICIMAGESGKVDPDAKYISVCTPSRWTSHLRDTAVVLKPSTCKGFFENPPHIYEISYSEKPKDAPTTT
jgi:hypothetical protein